MSNSAYSSEGSAFSGVSGSSGAGLSAGGSSAISGSSALSGSTVQIATRIFNSVKTTTVDFFVFFSKNSWESLGYFFLLLELLQLLSFSLDLSFGYNDFILFKIFRLLRTFSLSPTPDSYVLTTIILFGVYMVILSVFLVAFVHHIRSFKNDNKMVQMFRSFCEFCCRALFLPLGYCAINCYVFPTEGSLKAVSWGIAAPSLLMVVMICFGTFGFQHPINARSNALLAGLLPYSDILFFVETLCSSALLSVLLKFLDKQYAAIILAVFLILCSVAGVAVTVVMPGFFHTLANRFVVTIHFVVFGTAVVSLVTVLLGDKFESSYLFAFIAIGVGAACGVVGFFASAFLEEFFTKSVNELIETIISSDNDSIVAEKQHEISKTFCNRNAVKVASMYSFWNIKKKYPHLREDECVERMSQIFLQVIEEVPDDAFFEIIYAAFLLNSEDELGTVSIHLRRALTRKLAFVDSILLKTVEESRKNMVELVDKGAEEIQHALSRASILQQECLSRLSEFWKCIDKKDVYNITTELTALLSAQDKCIQLFVSISNECPKSVKIIRQYANFVDEVLFDKELSAVLYSNADLLEESQSKSHRKKNRLQSRNVQVKEEQQCLLKENEAENLDEANAAAERLSKVAFYRQQLASMKMTSFLLIKIVLVLLSLLLLAAVSVTYALSMNAFSNVRLSLSSSRTITSLSSRLSEIAMYSIGMYVSTCLSIPSSYTRYSSLIQNTATSLDSTTLEAYESAMNNSVLNTKLWTSPNFESTFWGKYSSTSEVRMDTILSALKEIVYRGGQVAKGNYADQNDIVSSSDYRYVVDNENEFARYSLGLVNSYQEDVIASEKSSTVILCCITIPLIVCTLFIAFGGSIRQLNRIAKERVHVLKMLLELPNSAIKKVLSSIHVEKRRVHVSRFNSSSHKKSNDDEDLSISMPNITQLIVMLGIGLVILEGITVANLLFAVTAMHSTDDPLLIYGLRSREIHVINKMYTSALLSISPDPVITAKQGNVDYFEEVKTLVDEYTSVKLEAQMKASRGKYEDVAEVKKLRDEFDCTDALGPSYPIGPCKGLADLDAILISKIRTFITLPQDQKDLQKEDWQVIERLMSEVVVKAHDDAEEAFFNYWVGTLDSSDTIVLLLFIIPFPIAVFTYIYSLLAIRKIQREQVKLFDLILMIPIDVIEEHEKLKTFLSTGVINLEETENDEDQNVDMQIEATQTKTERILQAAEDAVVVFHSETFQIEIFNEAAERMFGCTANEVINTSVTRFLPEDDLRQSRDRILAHLTRKEVNKDPKKTKDKQKDDKESVADNENEDKSGHETIDMATIHSDGTIIPATCSLSYTGSVCAAFIRDIRDIKGYQALIERNQMLLEKMLPRSIVERLKDSLMNNEQICFADAHSNVTILFADMVKFTNWSSNMDPSQLVSILNGLVCSWDTIARNNGVEKIKTIGDCYMAICGCPDENENHAKVMMEFAEEMIQTLTTFNELKDTSIQIRVGLHSGPVVAGVIGLTKTMYDIWGPNVSIAAKMESSGTPMHVHVSENTYELIKDDYVFTSDKDVQLKNGKTMKTFLYAPKVEAGKTTAIALIKQNKNSSVSSLRRAVSRSSRARP